MPVVGAAGPLLVLIVVDPAKICAPVSRHGGGLLPRGQWIGALSPCIRVPNLLPFLGRTPPIVGYQRREQGSGRHLSALRMPGLFKKEAKVCVEVNDVGRRKTTEMVTTCGLTPISSPG